MHIPNQELLPRWGYETFSDQGSVALGEVEFHALDGSGVLVTSQDTLYSG